VAKRISVLTAILLSFALGCRQRREPAHTAPTAVPTVAPQAPAAAPDAAPAASVVDAALARGRDAAELPKDPPGFYMGRRMATTMSHEGADWLTRPSRAREENPQKLMAALALKPGDVACDFGAGNGYHTLMMATSVAPNGRAVAADLQPQMLSLLQARARAAHVSNVETVQSTVDDPKFAPASCDVILIADVYHELSDPAAVLAQLKTALSPRGTLAIVEFRAEDPAVPVKVLHKMSKAQILRELTANGFALVRTVDDLPWQHVMFFAVQATP
jgi:2-polyprenyl-3-methyl-5-hydroxy-6-metoxy-1,4-benzoquinol methylase